VLCGSIGRFPPNLSLRAISPTVTFEKDPTRRGTSAAPAMAEGPRPGLDGLLPAESCDTIQLIVLE
jgi:hypothetical protein